MVKKILTGAAAVLLWLSVWQIAASVVAKELILPSPLSVFARLFEMLAEAEFYKTVAYSLSRVFVGMLAGVLIGALGGVITAFSSLAKALFSPILAVARSTPIASFIILLVLWLDRDTVTCVISALIVLPVVWSNVESGISGTDKALLEMASAYGMPRTAKLIHVYIPSALPYFTASLRSSLGMSWKAGIAAEALILPAISIGREMFTSKYNLETVDLFAWTVVVVILSVIIERLVTLLVGLASKRHIRATGGNTYGRA